MPSPDHDETTCPGGPSRWTRTSWPSVGAGGPVLGLHLCGELDIAVRDDLRRALGAVVADAERGVIIDFTHVRFCGAAEFGLLAGLGLAAAAHGSRCSVSGIGPQLDRFAELVWGAGWPTRYDSATVAVESYETTVPVHSGPCPGP